MVEGENICDRTYRAYVRQENKPDKPLTRSLSRHTNDDHKVMQEELHVACLPWLCGNLAKHFNTERAKFSHSPILHYACG